MLLANTKHLPPYVVPTLPDLLLMDEPRLHLSDGGIIPARRNEDDWLLAEVYWNDEHSFPTTSRYYLTYVSEIKKAHYETGWWLHDIGKTVIEWPDEEPFRGYVLFEEYWDPHAVKWAAAPEMWVVGSDCKAWESSDEKHNCALKLLLRDWEYKRDHHEWLCWTRHFKMIYSIHPSFSVNEMRELARRVWD